MTRSRHNRITGPRRCSCASMASCSTCIAALVLLVEVGSAESPSSTTATMTNSFANYNLSYTTPTDPVLQGQLEAIDSTLRARYGMTTNQTAVGLLDLRRLRLALVHPDREEYGASVPKIGILLAYFQTHPEAATNLDTAARHELGLMIKVSSNEMAAKFSRQLGLKQIQQILNDYHFYDTNQGGGLWVGKHYGAGSERI